MAFKKHVNFMFHQGKEFDDVDDILENVGEKSNMKGIKNISKVADLPADKILMALIQEAVQIAKKQ